MIKPAILYADELKKKMAETWYDPEYMYYYDTTPGIPDIADKPDNQYQFVSVNEQGEVVGFFSYWVYEPSKRAMNFGLIAFKKHNRVFIKDAVQMFKDMFEKFGVKSAEWRCYADNIEAIKLYRNLIKKYGGVEVGRLRMNGAPQNRKICDTIIFEVIRQDLFWENGKIVSKKEWNTHFNEWCDGIRDIDGTPIEKSSNDTSIVLPEDMNIEDAKDYARDLSQMKSLLSKEDIMEFNYEDILDRYTTRSNWVDGENTAVTKEEEAYLEQELTNKFRRGEMISSQEIDYIFNYEVFPWETGDIIDEGRHGWVVYEYIFTVGDDEHYMMTFWHHDDYGIGEYEAQEPICCYLKEVKVMKWVCEEEDK